MWVIRPAHNALPGKPGTAGLPGSYPSYVALSRRPLLAALGSRSCGICQGLPHLAISQAHRPLSKVAPRLDTPERLLKSRPFWTGRRLKMQTGGYIPRCHPGQDNRDQAIVQVCRLS